MHTPYFHTLVPQIVSVGLTYLFAAQTYHFGICANSTIKAPTNNLTDSDDEPAGPSNSAVLGLCTDFDLSQCRS